jgi:hypoxanthine phosphoribosyltransferase
MPAPHTLPSDHWPAADSSFLPALSHSLLFPPVEQVEDIVDTGRTAAALLQHFRAAGAASVALASLLSKPARREVDCAVDYLCFEVPDKFVVGYGLDYAELYRSLPYVGVLRPECYSKTQ